MYIHVKGLCTNIHNVHVYCMFLEGLFDVVHCYCLLLLPFVTCTSELVSCGASLLMHVHRKLYMHVHVAMERREHAMYMYMYMYVY